MITPNTIQVMCATDIPSRLTKSWRKRYIVRSDDFKLITSNQLILQRRKQMIEHNGHYKTNRD